MTLGTLICEISN